jgi:spore germination protein KC
MKKCFIAVYIFLFMPLCTACWDYREVDRLTIVTGFSIDKANNGGYLFTIEVVDLQGATSDKPVKSVLIESEGEGLLSAARNTVNKNYPRLYIGHTTIIILSQEVARDGVLKVLDLVFRDAETRLNINLLVSKDKTAGEILKAKALAEELVSVEINNMLEEQRILSKALPVPAYKFVNSLAEDGISGIMTSVCTGSNDEEKVVKLCGTAIFKGDKLQGFISDEETYALSFILDEVKGGVIVANTGTETDEEKISLEIRKSSTKINPEYTDGQLSVKVKIDTEVSLGEVASKKDFTDEKGREELKKITEKQLKEKIESMISKIQTDFGSDIFGFGNCFYKKLPTVWKEKRNEWDKLFRDLEVTVETNVEIKHIGLLSKPIQIGD